MTKIENPRVFISYCWSSPSHEMRIIEWAERLVSDGIDVLLDKWNLKEGQDKYDYMERMVNDSTVSKVLIFSDKKYTEKANSKKGGVGTESQIISNELYKNVSQEKFIPIVIEYDEKTGVPYLPTYLANRIYIDFSSPDKQNENYDTLLRVIFNKPRHKKPPLGSPPKHILEEEVYYSRSTTKLTTFKDSIMKEKSTFKGIAIDFLDSYYLTLLDHRIMEAPKEVQFDEFILDKIKELKPIRDEFIEFVIYFIKYKDVDILYNEVSKFFEKSIHFKYRPEDVSHWNDSWSDHLEFLIHELFIYYIAILIKFEKFDEINLQLKQRFLLPSHIRNNDNPTTNYISLYSYSDVLDKMNKRLNKRRLSIEADLFNERASISEINFESFMQADFTLFLYSMLNPSGMWSWYPVSLIYIRFSKIFDLYIRARDRSYFEKIIKMFNVNDKEDFISRYNEGAKNYQINRWDKLRFHSHVSFENLMNLEHLDTI